MYQEQYQWLHQLVSIMQSRNVCTRHKRYIQPGAKGEMIMDAQDIIELIEYFRNLQNNEMKFGIEELYDKLTEYIDFNRADSNRLMLAYK